MNAHSSPESSSLVQPKWELMPEPGIVESMNLPLLAENLTVQIHAWQDVRRAQFIVSAQSGPSPVDYDPDRERTIIQVLTANLEQLRCQPAAFTDVQRIAVRKTREALEALLHTLRVLRGMPQEKWGRESAARRIRQKTHALMEAAMNADVTG